MNLVEEIIKTMKQLKEEILKLEQEENQFLFSSDSQEDGE